MKRTAIFILLVLAVFGAVAQDDYTVNGVTFKMVYVEGGTFTMGCTSEQDGDCDSDETPVHSVTLSDYYIGETEVTQELWKAVMETNPSSFTGDSLPVETVSWDDCQQFIQKLNAQVEGQLPAGFHFALPTEAQWEYAARGGRNSKSYKYSGSNTIGNVSWNFYSIDFATHPVKTKVANELGVYDMSGNVWEWCTDWYDSYSSSPQTNPAGPNSGSYRVRRGGSWDINARHCRVAERGNSTPDSRIINVGFRLSLVHNNPDNNDRGGVPSGKENKTDDGSNTVTDIDGNTYKTVKIGEQVWMAENLKVTKDCVGNKIALDSVISRSTPYRYCPDDEPKNMEKYGYLYNFEAAKRVCPKGWHLPTGEEWSQLTDYVSSQSQYVCGDDRENIAKALASKEGWESFDGSCEVGNDPSSNNATGFSALPAGYGPGPNHNGLGYHTGFWSATEGGSFYARYLELDHYSAYVGLFGYNKGIGFSVRCVRD